MNIVFIFAALLFSVLAISIDDVELDFAKWMVQNDKKYEDNTQYLYRMAVYADNLKKIEQLNQQGGAVFAPNKFADLTFNEFRVMLGYRSNQTNKDDIPVLRYSRLAAPDTFDWISKGKVTPVKNQEQCGSCWAFSATENIESVWLIAKDLTPDNFKPLAPQQIVDCDKNDGGCNGGDTPTAYEYVIHAGGMDTEESYPYRARDGTCAFKPADVEVKIAGYSYATKTKNEEEMKTAVATVAPLSICVDAQPWQFYSKGVMTRAQCGLNLDHCVQITGYDTSASPPYWVVRNSWGRNWGEAGYIRLEYGTNTCGVAEEATTARV
jgi:C1A family cysteine protease